MSAHYGPKLPAELVEDFRAIFEAGPQPPAKMEPCPHPFTFDCDRCRERWLELLEEAIKEVYVETWREQK